MIQQNLPKYKRGCSTKKKHNKQYLENLEKLKKQKQKKTK